MLRFFNPKRGNTNSNFFFRRFNLITFQIFLAIGCLIGALVYFEVSAEKEKDTDKIANEVAERSLYLSSKLDNLKKQVAILQAEATSNFDIPYEKFNMPGELQNFVVQGDKSFSFDALPDSLQQYYGNLTGTGIFFQRNKENLFRRELTQQFRLASLYRAIMKQHPELTWIYTISKNNYLCVYPFFLSYVANFDSTYHEYDIFKMGTPGTNVERNLYITPPYLDAGNKGLMISIGAPVYEKNEFRSIVGVDVTLGFLTSYVKNYKEGTMMIVNEKNQILAHPTLMHDSDTIVRDLSAVLDPFTVAQLSQVKVLQFENSRIFVEKMNSVPWKIIVVTTPAKLTFETVIDRYYIVLLALIGAILFLVLFTNKHFIKPALDIVLFIDGHSNNKIIRPKVIHPSWQHWFNLVSAAFEKKKEVIYHLDEEVKRKNAELVSTNQALMTQREQLVREHQAKDRIFSIVSHDLKSPIASLVGILDLLAKGNITDRELKHLLPIVELRVQRIKLMLENLLQWSICNLRAERISIKPISLNDAIRENVDLLEPFAELKSIKINFAGSFRHIVETDLAVLNLVLRNLIFNAIKFSHKESNILIWFDISHAGTTVYVKDHGKGIPETHRSKIFTFGENVSDGTLEEKGTGLGLALCKEFLKKVHATITFQSEIDKETIFSFTLPNKVDTSSDSKPQLVKSAGNHQFKDSQRLLPDKK